jgi:hypothetical protein
VTTNEKNRSKETPFDDVFMEVGNERQTKGAPMLLKSGFANKFSLTVPSRFGEFRLAAVSGGELVEFEPNAETWVKPVEGKLVWSITPKGAGDQFTLVLYSRNFDDILEFQCESYADDHPWYASSRIYLHASNTNGFHAHRGRVAIARDKVLGFEVFPVGKGLFGKKITLTVTGDRGVPEVFPVEPQVIENLNIWWRLTFDPADEGIPFTVWLEADGIAEKVGFEFLPFEE